jgi:hypothetical protein
VSQGTATCDGCGSGLDLEPIAGGFQCRECFERAADSRNPERADLSDSGVSVPKGRNASHSLREGSSVPVPVPVPYLDGERADLDELLNRHAKGQIRPETVPLPELPAYATDSMRRVLKHMALCVGLIRAENAPGDDGTVIYAVDWAARHVGLSGKTVSVALGKLRRCGAVRIVKVLDPMEPRQRAGSRVYAIESPGTDGTLPHSTGDVEAAVGVRGAVHVHQPHMEVVDDASVGNAVGRRPAGDLDGFDAATSSTAGIGIGHTLNLTLEGDSKPRCAIFDIDDLTPSTTGIINP